MVCVCGPALSEREFSRLKCETLSRVIAAPTRGCFQPGELSKAEKKKPYLKTADLKTELNITDSL